ncbi:MAG: hypothetical protein WEB06_20145 [Actinomycetota bacterium]
MPARGQTLPHSRLESKAWLSSISSTPSSATSREWRPSSRRETAFSSASGDGTVAGPLLTGALRWTLFERPGDLVCAMSPTLRIDTRDGAQIRADARGFATRRATDASEWRVAATLCF